MILFLHGAGERGTDIWKVATHGPPKNVSTHPDFPFIVVSPQCPERQIWSREVLLGLLDDCTAKYRGGYEPDLPDRAEHGRLRHLGLWLDAPGEVCGHRADLRRRPDDRRAPGKPGPRGRR